jgi:hypothetical protein
LGIGNMLGVLILDCNGGLPKSMLCFGRLTLCSPYRNTILRFYEGSVGGLLWGLSMCSESFLRFYSDSNLNL